MDIQKLHDRLKELNDQREALIEKAQKEERDLSEAEDKTFEELTAKAAVVRKQIAQAEALKADQDKVDDLSASAGRRTSQQEPDTSHTLNASNVHNIQFTGEPRSVQADNKGFRTPREFVLAVTKAYRSNNVDDRLKPLQARNFAAGSDEQSTIEDPYGGFLVPIAFTPTVLQVEPEPDPTAGTRKIPMSSPRIEISARVDKTHSNSVTGGLRVYRRAETKQATSSRMEVEKIGLDANALMGLAYETEELLTDSPVSFAALLAQGFRDEFTSKLIDERLNGTGAGGQYTGIINCPAVIQVDKESGQAADTIVWKNIIKMRSRCWHYDRAVWLYNHDCLPQLMQLKYEIGSSGVLMWQTSGREGEPDMLAGRPAYATEYTKTVGDAGDLVLVVWSEYLEGVYQPMQTGESVHLRFDYNERAFKFWMRNAGAPWWRSELTPKNSTTTLSPFVKLQART